MDNEQDAYTQSVAAILTRAKERSGLSFSKIAEQTGIARATVVRVLAGERPITTFYLHQLARAFGISPAAVLGEADASAIDEHDYALAASDDDDWQRRQEEENA